MADASGGVTIPMMRNNGSRLLFLVGSGGGLVGSGGVKNPKGRGADPATGPPRFSWDVLSLPRQNYVEPVETKALLQGAYDGMSDALDPFSYYVPASERAAYRAQL